MKTYNNIIAAMKIIIDARGQISNEVGYVMITPAWAMLNHAELYLREQANAAMRGDDLK